MYDEKRYVLGHDVQQFLAQVVAPEVPPFADGKKGALELASPRVHVWTARHLVQGKGPSHTSGSGRMVPHFEAQWTSSQIQIGLLEPEESTPSLVLGPVDCSPEARASLS